MNRILIIGYGIQGKKRHIIEKEKVVSIVDPFEKIADYKNIYEVPLDTFDIAYVCCPDNYKEEIINFLVKNQKHILIEKPLFPVGFNFLKKINTISKKNKTVIYVAYNHRFEPNILDVKEILDHKIIGNIYYIHFFYGNGTAQNIVKSEWRNNKNSGIFEDLGCHILDLIDFFNIDIDIKLLKTVLVSSFETSSLDYGQFIINGNIKIVVSLSNLSWKNNFFIDCIGQKGSAHAMSLCKWGKSKSVVRERVFPSGVPIEKENCYTIKDPTWIRESKHFFDLIKRKESGVDDKEFKTLEMLQKIRSCLII